MQSGELNGAVIFTGIENLTGGTSTDSFVVDPASDGFNAVNGGSGLDTLDDSALVGPITVDLATKTAPKLTSFTAIESLLGTSDTGDVLIGANANTTWTLKDSNAGTAGAVSFSSFENLTGGNLNDVFRLLDGGSVAGTLTGGGGMDVLDYSYFNSAVGANVNLSAGAATATGGVSGFTVLVGSDGADTLSGDDSINAILGGGGVDTLIGLAGYDLLIGGTGADMIFAGPHQDILFGGSTTYYSESSKSLNLSAISTILQEWTSGTSYAERISSLTTGSGADSIEHVHQ